MPLRCALYLISKRWANQKQSILFSILDMEQPRIIVDDQQQPSRGAKKRALPPPDDSDYDQPSPLKRLAKNFENSLGFSETNYSCSRSLSFQGHRPHPQPQEGTKDSEQPNFTTELMRANLMSDREVGVSRFKALLPPHLSSRLSPMYEHILRVSSETDRILSKCSLLSCMQSFSNVQIELSQLLNAEVDLHLYQGINYLLSSHYHFYHDPLKNLVVGLPSNAQSLPMRKFRLRKALYQHVISLSTPENPVETISCSLPQQPFEVARTQLFFPNRSKKVQNKNVKLSQSFLQDLRQQIKGKQLLLESKVLEKQGAADITDLSSFIDQLQELFQKFKVKNIFRVSILEYFSRKGKDIQEIKDNLERVQKAGGYLVRKQMENTTIYELNPDEKATAIRIIGSQLA